MERKTGFEPATLTLARWCFSSRGSALLPCRGVLSTQFHFVHRVRPCSRAVYYPNRLTQATAAALLVVRPSEDMQELRQRDKRERLSRPGVE